MSGFKKLSLPLVHCLMLLAKCFPSANRILYNLRFGVQRLVNSDMQQSFRSSIFGHSNFLTFAWGCCWKETALNNYAQLVAVKGLKEGLSVDFLTFLPMCFGAEWWFSYSSFVCFFPHFSDLIEIRESHFTAQSLCVVPGGFTSEDFLLFEKNQYFGKNLYLKSLLVMFVSYFPFKYGFKIVHILF